MVTSIEDPRAVREWFVAFVDARSAWYHRFLKRGFRHVFAFGYQPSAGRWLLYDLGFEGTNLRILRGAEVDALATTVANEGGRVLRAQVQDCFVGQPRLLASCVTAIAHLLGLPGCAVTPYALYRQLLRHGAQPAFVRST